MARIRAGLCTALALLGAGCSSGSDDTSVDMNGGSGVGGAVSGAGNDSGGMGGMSGGGTGGAMPVEVKSNRPQIEFVGAGEIVVTSAHMTLESVNGFMSFQMQGDLLNTTDELLCIPLINLKMGARSILSVVVGTGYFIEEALSQSSFPCLLPRGTAMFNSIENDVPPTLLDTATQITYEISALPSATAVLHPAIPSEIAAIVETAPQSGFQVSGQLTIQSMTVDVLEIDVFPRDDQGLAFDDLLFIHEDVAAETPIDFTTPATSMSFTEFDLFAGVTVGEPELPLPTFAALPSTEDEIVARRRAHHERMLRARSAWARVSHD